MKTLKISNEISFKDLLILILLAILGFSLYNHICGDNKKIERIETYLENMSKAVSETQIGVENISKQLKCDLYDECGQFNNN